jgi:hypothetical protein
MPDQVLIVLTHKNVFSYISGHIERVLFNISGSSPETGMKAVTGAEIEDVFRGGSKDGPAGRGSVKNTDVIQGRIQKVGGAAGRLRRSL